MGIYDIHYKVKVEVSGLKALPLYLAEEYAKAANSTGLVLQGRIRQLQRKDTGEERRETRYKVFSRGGLNVSISVFNNKIQALIDETGARWTTRMPPFHRGSKLYAWAMRKGFSAAAVYPIARAIFKRGLPRPGDALRKPFERVREQSRAGIQQRFEQATQRAILRSQ